MANEHITWEREGHTRAKHELLRAFFNKWVSVHSGHFARLGGGLVRVFDGFAGPGIYSGGEPGSPRILLHALLSNPNLRTAWRDVRYEFSFVEQNRKRAEMLKRGIEEYESVLVSAGGWASQLRWSVTCGRYEEHVPQPVKGESALFLFLDPFGYSHSPMTLTQDLVQQPKSDTLIFLPLSFVHRFADREGQQDALDRFFGTRAWRDVPNGPDRPRALLRLFESQLMAAGLSWTRRFRLRPPDGNSEYWIVGASSDPQGDESIKEGFWAVDGRHGQGFSPSRPVPLGQQTLGFDEPEQQPDTSPLLDTLRRALGDRWFTVEEAEECTQKSRFLQTHLRTRTLAIAENAGDLEVRRPLGVRQFPRGRGVEMRFV